MKYNIHVYQQGIVEAGLHKQTDLTDWAIIDYIKDFFFSGKSRKLEIENERYVWVNYQALAESLPLCGLRSKAAVANRIKKLSKLGLIDVAKNSGNAYVKPSSKAIELIGVKRERVHGSEHRSPKCATVHESEHQEFMEVNGGVHGSEQHNNNPPISPLNNNQKENRAIGARSLPGALPQTPTPSPDMPAPLPQDGKSTEIVGDNGARSMHQSSSASGGDDRVTAKNIVGVWAKRLSMVPGIRGPGQAKRRQWAGELEQWVKEDGGLTCQEILDVLIFGMEDPFWRSRIISPKALRRHWDTLVAQRSVRGAEADIEEVLNEFGRAYEAARGKRYIFQCKDRFKARELLGQMGKEEIVGLFKRFFEVDDPFLDKQGRSFTCFAGQINRLRGSNSGGYYVPFEEFLKEKARRKAKEGGADGKGGDTTEGRDGGGVAVGCDTS